MSQQKNGLLFTSESVTEGHPDKLADFISDSVLDAIFEQDPMSRVACETLVTTGFCVVAGEITTKAVVDYPQVVRDAIITIGYTGGDSGFDGRTCGVLMALDKQSPDIAQGVDSAPDKEQGAGDQGMMFGYACNETPELMPLPISLAHKLGLKLSELRHSGVLPWLQPDGKSQVTIEYRDGQPHRIHTIVISNQHSPDISQQDIRDAVIRQVCEPVVPKALVNGDIIYHVNPTGRFVVGGPVGDCGLTGRKIIVDTYGGMGRHGGGAFSGKDPSKVDRSATYMARYMAKNVVAAGLAAKCEVQLAYAIGVARPVSINVTTFGTGALGDDALSALLAEEFDCRPAAILETLNLRAPIFRKTTNYGHFGRENAGLRWENTDRAEALRQRAGV
ncbi:MAG TPA: methionine adenosyltransferase [Candidatus Hydrogenedentes bacterium]|jgi:S-adenosylmethionine synthetase|nr:methionine adenosyltransferase [Candidatus Hydrogenedentota bacterium]MDY0033174.1 methionine adenosyltransferase [FCB group bacterium]HPV38896.1 methionine adenosyltransferase [Candidatus Hydrogenedentota bacterium]HPX40465.1 methionine adenosyltransferase [Candidatus Hydrogenedentota bacterium]HQH69705.1 methionine adenosyltransferase [Candidatus Hydrogenedentota bacterium]